MASLQPGHPALLGMDGTVLTYGQLDRKAGAWSARLSELGVRPGSIVPVLMSRSPDLAVLLLAVLKCGAAYAALDYRWPDARIREVLTRLGSPVFVTGQKWQPTAARLGVDAWTPPPLSEPDPHPAQPAPAPRTGPDSPACVFFTSGTTGESKSVLSPHQATTRLFDSSGSMPFGPGRVMPQTVFLSWDVANFELWGMLTTGGTSVVVEEDYLTPHLVSELLSRYGVNTMWLTTSLFNLFVSEEIECFDGLRHLYVGGERLSAPHVRSFVAKYPGVEIRNSYGPVESCVFVTTHLISQADCDDDAIPIGRPVPGTEVFILDGDRMLGPGQPGEICLAGAGLALGYLGDERLTGTKFPSVPVRGQPVRVYRTGDLGVQDETGLFHFMGRTDRQIKLRGQRIELDGIEAQAAAAAPLAACAVVALSGGTLSQYDRLALFYTVATGTELPDDGGDPLGVRHKLAGRLPSYAVPDLVRAVRQLPLNANGKINYEALRSDPFFV
jgi:amino acid adenylation domain-containing protein